MKEFIWIVLCLGFIYSYLLTLLKGIRLVEGFH